MTPRDGILILDAEQAVIEEANPFITELLGYSRDELVGRAFRDLGFVGDRARVAALFEKVRRDGFVRCARLPIRIRDDGDILVEFVGNSYLVDNRKVIQLNLRGLSDRDEEPDALPPEGAEVDPHDVVRTGQAVQLEADSLLEKITGDACVCLGADLAELYLHRPEKEALELAHGAGIRAPEPGAGAWPGAGVAARVCESGEGLVRRGGEAPFRSALGAPVRWRGKLLGVLALVAERDGAFSERDLEQLDRYAAQAALAIVNGRLSAEIEQLAVVDELTGVFNRRGLVILGSREVERARRLGHPLAVLFVDLDHFKSLNDEYSHEVGDKALRRISRRIHDTMRKIDVVARYGGEEFVVLLVETELGSAVEVAERVRQAVEATNLATDRGTAHLTVSVGVTVRGPETLDLDALIRRADEAMYAAKQAGRNRVVALAS